MKFRICKSHFARYGIPDTLITGNGPQFNSQTLKNFAQQYGFQHCTSSPHYPQSNDRAEKAVQTIKNLIKKTSDDKGDIYLALLELRYTPVNEQLGSPAQRLMGRCTKTLLPTSSRSLIPQTIKPEIVRNQLKRQDKQKQYYDQHAKQLPELKKGDKVRLRSRNISIMTIIRVKRIFKAATPMC